MVTTLISLPSSTMAVARPTFSRVSSAKSGAPSEVISKWMLSWALIGSCWIMARLRCLPVSPFSGSFFTRKESVAAGPPSPGSRASSRISYPGIIAPSARSWALRSWTMRNSRKAGRVRGAAGHLVVGVGEARQLDQDPVLPHRLQHRLGHPEAVDARAQDLDRLGQHLGADTVRGELAGVELYQEGDAALEVQPQLDLTGRLVLEDVEEGADLVVLAFQRDAGKERGDIVGADGLHQAGVLPVGPFQIQAPGPPDDGVGDFGQLRIAAVRLLVEVLDQVPAGRRVDLPKGPGQDEGHQRPLPEVAGTHGQTRFGARDGSAGPRSPPAPSGLRLSLLTALPGLVTDVGYRTLEDVQLAVRRPDRYAPVAHPHHHSTIPPEVTTLSPTLSDSSSLACCLLRTDWGRISRT